MMVQKIIGIHSLLLVLFTSSVYAQSDLQRCDSLSSVTEKLACFEALAAEERARMADAFAEPRGRDARADSGPPATPAEAREAIGAERITKNDAKPVNDTSQTPVKSAKQQALEGISFEVVRIKKDGERRHLFYMSDGQLWREIEPTTVIFPKRRSFNVVINQGRLGDYRLRVDGKGRRTRVERLR